MQPRTSVSCYVLPFVLSVTWELSRDAITYIRQLLRTSASAATYIRQLLRTPVRAERNVGVV